MKRPALLFGLATVGLAAVVYFGDRLLLPPVVTGTVSLEGEGLPTWTGTPSRCSYRGTRLATPVGPDESLQLVADVAGIELRAEDGSIRWQGRPTCVHASMSSDPDSHHGAGKIAYDCPGDPVNIRLKLERCDRATFGF